MSADFTPEKENYKILPPFKMQVLTNFPYIEADFDALTNYQLLCKVVEYLNAVIHNENEVTEQVNGLYNAYVSLQNYVNNYFDNLDVQEEINNKLDEMAESGQLTDIIAQYLGLAGMITFNNVAEMKLAENLVNGSKCATFGYHNVNDGGNAFYKIRTITNEDTVDEMFIIALYDNTLVAELIIDEYINPNQLGAYGDGTHDDTLSIQSAINKGNVKLYKGTYLLSDTINIGSNKIFDGNKCYLKTSSNKFALKCQGTSINNAVVETSIKHVLINTSSGGSGILIDKCYFIYIDDVNIFQLKENNAIGFKQIDSFNIVISNSRVYGDVNYTGLIGLDISTDSETSINNITNCKYDTLLLQNLEYGVKMQATNTANMNEFNNLGFSNNDYCFYFSGYNYPVSVTNTRMENGSKDSTTNLYGFYITGSINMNITNINAYNIDSVIYNEGTEIICLDGSCSFTGTSQSTKKNVIDKSNATIINKANIYMQGATYNLTKSGWNSDSTSAQINNVNKIRTNDITTGNTINLSATYVGITKTSVDILNIYGSKGCEAYIWTDTSNIHIYGTGNSTTNKWSGTITLEPYKLYHVIAIETNQMALIQ